MYNKIYLGCTKKLLDQTNVKFLYISKNYLPSIYTWHVGLNYINRKKCLIFMNDLTRFTFFLYGVKKKDLEGINDLFKKSLIETLKSEKFKEEEIYKIINDNYQIEIMKIVNRSVLGSMTDFWKIIPYYLFETDKEYLKDSDKINLIQLNKALNRTPMLCSKKGMYPIQEMQKELKNG